MSSTKLVSKMKLIICVLFLSVLTGLYGLAIDNEKPLHQPIEMHDDATDDEHKNKILDLLNVTSYQVVEVDDKLDKTKGLVRVRRSSSSKIYKKGCERDLALASTFGGGGVGAAGGAAAGAIAGSVVPVVGTAVGALLGKVS